MNRFTAKHGQGTGLKGQLIAPNKATAIVYKQCLDEFAMVSAEVSMPGTPLLRGSDFNVVGQPIQVLLYAGKFMVLCRILYPSLTTLPE